MKTRNLNQKMNLENKNKGWNILIDTPELARIIADINSDGHIQLKDWRGLVSFYSKNLEEINRVNYNFKELFGIEGRIYKDKRENLRYKLFFISRDLAKFLENQGAVIGNKTNIPYLIPSWIFDGQKELKRAYLIGFFTSEGCISTWEEKGKERSRIYISQSKSEKIIKSGEKYMEQIRSMLNDLGIVSNPIRLKPGKLRKDGSKSKEIIITIGPKSFEKFYKEVGFDDPSKKLKLRKALEAWPSS